MRPNLSATSRRSGALAVLAVLVSLLAGACLPAAPPSARSGDATVRWNPCGVLHYQIDPYGMPVGWSADVHDAFRAASGATGIPSRYDGVVAHSRPHSDANDPIRVSYGHVGGGSVGYAEPTRVGTRYIGGTILLDPAAARTRTAHRAAAFHEVGHMFGLAHPPSAFSSTMVMGRAPAPYRSPDIAGFRAVGRQPGECH